MRKMLLLASCVLVMSTGFGASSIVVPKAPKIKATEIFLPVGTSGQKISLMELSRIPQSQLELMTGRKMKGFEKTAFNAAQRKLQRNINPDGTFKKKKYEKFFTKKAKGGETGFHFGGFALGFFVGLIGVLIAYLINDDYKSNRVKWAWIGFGIAVVINVILIIAILNSVKDFE
jgi:hypothetical protein